MPGSDYLGSFLAQHPSAAEITKYSTNVANALEHQGTNATAPAQQKQAGGKPRGLECLLKKDLVERAKKRKIAGYTKMNKAQLIEALRAKNKK